MPAKKPVKKAIKKAAAPTHKEVRDPLVRKALRTHGYERDDSGQLVIYPEKSDKNLSHLTRKYGQAERDNDGNKVVYTNMMFHPKSGKLVHMNEADYK